MKVEGYINNIDEIDIGLSMYYGSDDNGNFHCIQLGFVIVTVCIFRYIK